MVMFYCYVSLPEGNIKIPSDKNPSELEHHHFKEVNQGIKCAMASTAIKLPEAIIKYNGNGSLMGKCEWEVSLPRKTDLCFFKMDDM